MNIETLKAIDEADDTLFGELYALSKIGDEAGIKKEAKKALERTRPAEYAATKLVFRGVLGSDDKKFSKKLATIALPETLLVSIAKATMVKSKYDVLGFKYLCSVGGEGATFALQQKVDQNNFLSLLDFNGALPDELANVKGVKGMQVAANKLKEFPEVLYEVEGLEHLDFSESKLKNIGDAFMGFKSLTSLELEVPKKCKLGKLPPLKRLRIDQVDDLATVFLPSLEELGIGDDKMKQIPAEIGQLQNLKILFCPREVTQIDNALWTLRGLEELGLSGLELESLPEEIGELKSLKRLHLRGCKLTALPEAFGKLSSLEELDLVFAKSLQSVPEAFYDLPLKRLRIQYTPLAKHEEAIKAKMPNVEIYK